MIAPSTDPAKDIQDLLNYIGIIEDCADMLHCDVMDGCFVERKTFSGEFLDVINKKTTMPLDVHLMIEKPHKKVLSYIQKGANIVTVHFEAFKNSKAVLKCLKHIKKNGALCGLSIKPKTKIDDIKEFLSFVDLVLVMSVEPGKSGQVFMEDSLSKIVMLNNIRKEYDLGYKIEVDGGINNQNAQRVISAGADILVSGNYVYSSDNKANAINSLKG